MKYDEKQHEDGKSYKQHRAYAEICWECLSDYYGFLSAGVSIQMRLLSIFLIVKNAGTVSLMTRTQ